MGRAGIPAALGTACTGASRGCEAGRCALGLRGVRFGWLKSCLCQLAWSVLRELEEPTGFPAGQQLGHGSVRCWGCDPWSQLNASLCLLKFWAGLGLGSQKQAALTYGWKKLSSKGCNSSQSCWQDCQTWRLPLHLPFSSLNWECLLAGAVPPLLARAQPKICCHVSEGLLIWQIVHALPCYSGVWSKTQTPIFRFLLLLMGCGLSTNIFMNQISKGVMAWWGCRKDCALRLGSSLPSNTFLDSQ